MRRVVPVALLLLAGRLNNLPPIASPSRRVRAACATEYRPVPGFRDDPGLRGAEAAGTNAALEVVLRKWGV